MALIGFIFLIISSLNLSFLFGENSITFSSFLSGCGVQAAITFATMILFAFFVVPFISSVIVFGLALIGSYYFPSMTITFISTALGVCLMMFSAPDTSK